MKNLLIKEIRLASSLLSYLFLLFSLMTLIPGYPIMVGSFFVCLGIFQSFQNARETNDILYTVLLPVEKADAVRAKYVFVCFIQIIAWVLMAALTVLRMTVLGNAGPYVTNPMMNANPVYLGWCALVFTNFNVLYLGGFFRTGYKFGKPFVLFASLSGILVIAGEVLHHIPGLEFLNGTDRLGVQAVFMLVCLAVYILGTLLSCRGAIRSFEKIDL